MPRLTTVRKKTATSTCRVRGCCARSSSGPPPRRLSVAAASTFAPHAQWDDQQPQQEEGRNRDKPEETGVRADPPPERMADVEDDERQRGDGRQRGAGERERVTRECQDCSTSRSRILLEREEVRHHAPRPHRACNPASSFSPWVSSSALRSSRRVRRATCGGPRRSASSRHHRA